MLINLCFHGIGACSEEREPGEAHYWITRDAFLGILDRVRDEPDVRLSFDDGNKSDVDTALPALQERGLQATFFPLAGRLADPRSLSPDDLTHLRASGMSIGSHGWAHIPWRGLDSVESRRELVEAREVLVEASGGEISRVALPLGRYDRGLLTRLRACAYQAVYTSDRFPARPDSWLQARYSVTAHDTPESVGALLEHRSTLEDLRNLTKSLMKRAV